MVRDTTLLKTRKNHLVLVVAGTRPKIVKPALIHGSMRVMGIDSTFAWSGQHYDLEMSRVFMEQLGLGNPDVDPHAPNPAHDDYPEDC